MPATIFSGSKVKALKDRLSLNDTTEIISVTSNPQVGGLVAPIGSLALDSVAGKLYKKVGSANTNWSEVGAGVGGINYISNPDAENGTTGWSTYADAAGTAPVDGTGGSANITWSRSTTTPLRGAADFNLVKDAANRQGQGVSVDFTIDPADQAKVLNVSFDYEILSGTYATGDLAVYLIADPAGTPVVIQPAGYQVQSATSGNKLRQIATFQTQATGQSYRLCIHVASTNASAYTLAVDNVIVGPQVVQYGAPVTDWVSYTPIIQHNSGGVTNLNKTAYWRRVGGNLEVIFDMEYSAGTAAFNAFSMSFPPGLVASSIIDENAFSIIGNFQIHDSGSSVFTGNLHLTGNKTEAAFRVDQIGTHVGNIPVSTLDMSSTFPMIPASGDDITGYFTVPIQGWSSTVQMSNDTDTRVVAMRAEGNPASATSGNPIIVPTVGSDTHGAYSASTGKFTAPVSGYYMVQGFLASAASGVTIRLYVDSILEADIGQTDSNGECTFIGMRYLNAGQQVWISTLTTFDAIDAELYIFRLSGPSAIAASETVVANYSTGAGQSIGTSDTLITFGTKETDTHGAFSGTVFTAPVSGTYNIQSKIIMGAVTLGAGAIGLLKLYKNGINYKILANWNGTGVNSYYGGSGSINVKLNAGETLSFYAINGVSSNLTNGAENYMSIVKVGI